MEYLVKMGYLNLNKTIMCFPSRFQCLQQYGKAKAYRLSSHRLNCQTNFQQYNSFPEAQRLLSVHQSNQVEIYVETLLKWNEQMNLTAITEKGQVMERHVAESLSLVPFIDQLPFQEEEKHNFRIIDVGTGAGLPGILLAIAKPEWNVVLLDSLKKRCNFLEASIEATGLTNAKVVWGRAEDAARGELRESCHVAVARAVAELRILSELCLPFVKLGGHFLAPKGPKSEEEVKFAKDAISILGGSAPQIVHFTAGNEQSTRTVIQCKKIVLCPEKFPRRPGMPNKRPL